MIEILFIIALIVITIILIFMTTKSQKIAENHNKSYFQEDFDKDIEEELDDFIAMLESDDE